MACHEFLRRTLTCYNVTSVFTACLEWAYSSQPVESFSSFRSHFSTLFHAGTPSSPIHDSGFAHVSLGTSLFRVRVLEQPHPHEQSIRHWWLVPPSPSTKTSRPSREPAQPSPDRHKVSIIAVVRRISVPSANSLATSFASSMLSLVFVPCIVSSAVIRPH